MFVVEVQHFVGLYKVVATNYTEYQFGFVILSDYGNPEDQQKRYSDLYEVEISFFTSK